MVQRDLVAPGEGDRTFATTWTCEQCARRLASLYEPENQAQELPPPARFALSELSREGFAADLAGGRSMLGFRGYLVLVVGRFRPQTTGCLIHVSTRPNPVRRVGVAFLTAVFALLVSLPFTWRVGGPGSFSTSVVHGIAVGAGVVAGILVAELLGYRDRARVLREDHLAAFMRAVFAAEEVLV